MPPPPPPPPPPNIRGLDRGRVGLDSRSGSTGPLNLFVLLGHRVSVVKRFDFSMTDDISSIVFVSSVSFLLG